MSDQPPAPPAPRPKHLDLKKDDGLTVHWDDGRESFFPVAFLRKMSPSADSQALRQEMQRNPLTVLPSATGQSNEPLTATGAELVGNYAVRISFSDGHHTGLYSWEYLREIDPTPRDADGGGSEVADS